MHEGAVVTRYNEPYRQCQYLAVPVGSIAIVVAIVREPESVDDTSDGFIHVGRGGLASSAWHIDQMGQPPRLDVWACAQGNVRWWMSIRSAGGTCLCLTCACIQDR